jgi:phosphate transport system substrate-binding protein
MRRPSARCPRRFAGLVRLTAATAAAVPLLTLAATPAYAGGYVPITGSGSTWSQVALSAWAADVRTEGLVVNYSGDGSSAGRADYIDGQSQFAVSEIPFENPPEPGQQPEVPKRSYAYLPIIAGGTSFMYHLTVNGKQYRNLRLSGQTLTKIFTGQITNWDNPAITHDNGTQLPNEPIIPVLRADGAGSSAQFSRYMWKQYPSLWCPFQEKYEHLPASECGITSFYPGFSNSKSQVGDNGVADYIAASYGEGAIGFVEFAYAKQLNYPVASMLNAAGYFTQPSAGDVAVALTRAKINYDKNSPLYLTQDLDSVYAYRDPRTYPLSSYSYMIIPTSTQAPFDQSGDGRSLSTFINYFLCAGQQKAQILGYSPVPKNLVEAGFKQVHKIPGFVSPPAIGSCHNPALDILHTAPRVLPCQKLGAAPCGTTPSGTAGNGSTGTGPSTSANRTTGTRGGGTSAGTGNPAGGSSGGGAAGGAINPLTGQPSTGGTSTTAGAPGGSTTAVATSLSADRETSSKTTVLYALSAVLLLGTVLAPPVVIARRRRQVR